MLSPVFLPTLPPLRFAFNSSALRKERANAVACAGSFILRLSVRSLLRARHCWRLWDVPVCQVDKSLLSWGSYSRGDLIVLPLPKSKGHFDNGYCVGTKEGPPNGEILSLVMGRWKKEQESFKFAPEDTILRVLLHQGDGGFGP